MHPAALPIDQLLSDCRVQRTRRSGPGGQHRNKVETAVVITHTPTGVQAEASERRSQQQNREQALQRLRVKLALALRSDLAEEPSGLWQQRVRGGRLSINPEHTDFPAVLAEALDALAVLDYEPRAVADRLGVSSSQLVKLLKLHHEALTQVNRERHSRGLAPLR